MILRPIGGVLLLCWIFAIGAATAQADRDELRFLEGLRERRLFRLAESYCRERLDDSALPSIRRVDLTLELIRCYATQAVHVPPAESPRYWKKARETATDFQQQYPSDPRLLLVLVQDALTVLARGELHRQESEVLAEPAEAAEAARAALREATRLLAQLNDQITREIPQRHRAPPGAAALTVDELISLQQNVQFQLARVYRNQALSYPADSEDRIAALTSAVEQLQMPLTQIADNDPLIWPIRLDLAICLRLLGRLDEAEQRLQELQQSEAAAAIAWRARAECVRLNLDRRQPDQALAVFESGRPPAGQSAADLDFAYLETCLALWQAATATDDAAADTWRNRAAEVVRSIEQMHGPYWGRRGDLLLVRTVGLSQAAGNVDILSRTADGLYRQGQWAEAVATYEQAGAEALAAGQTVQGFELRYKAALVEHARQQHQSASQRLRRLALDWPDQPQAPDVHLLAAWNAAQLARSQPDALDDYAEILWEHPARWPTSPTADTARLWLGRLRESQGQWQAAAQAFQAVSHQHDEHPTAWQSAARCWNRAFASTGGDRSPDRSAIRDAVDGFWRHTPAGSDDADRSWTEADRYCAEQAARLSLEFLPDGYAEAERMLRAALDGNPPPNEPWRSRAEPLWIVALAAQPARRSMAEQQLATIDWPSPDSLWQVLTGLKRLLGNEAARTDERRRLAALLGVVADRLHQRRQQLSVERQTQLERIRAEALLVAERRDQAQTAYAELAAKYPDDGPVQHAYAQLLLESGLRDDWQQALDAWRRIATRSRLGSESWYEARYAIAAALIQLGQRDEAARRIRYLQALPPGLDDSPWHAKFQQLLEQCESSP